MPARHPVEHYAAGPHLQYLPLPLRWRFMQFLELAHCASVISFTKLSFHNLCAGNRAPLEREGASLRVLGSGRAP